MEGWENWRFANDFGYFHTKKYFEYQEIYATLILHDKIKESGDWSMSGLFRALHRTKVFRNLTEQEFAWVLYDVGNSAFIMLACSLIPIWFKSLAIGTGPGKISSDQATAYYSIAISIVTVVVALIGPVCGVLADRKDKKKIFFTTTAGLGITGCVLNGVATSFLSWFGGEPLLYFEKIIYPLSIFIKQLAEEHHVKFSNSITTNGFFLTGSVIEKCKTIDLKKIQITLDGDKESHDKIRNQGGKPSFDKILQNSIALCNSCSDAVIKLRINYNTDNIQHDFSEVLREIPENLRSRFFIQFQRIWQTYQNESNDEIVKRYLDENFFKLKKEGFNLSVNTNYNKFGGISCYADRINYANINYDGNVYKCTAQDYTSETALGFLDENGQIRWDKEKTQGIDKQAFFDNQVCLNCKYLAICGGPCFYAWWKCVRNKNNIECPNKKDKLDIDLPLFIREYYLGRLKKKYCN